MMFADLHLHTVHSDGTYQPADLVASARRHELAAIALTDHDTLEGCAEVGAEARAAGLDFVVGTEITAGLDGRELHILGYLVDPAHAGLSAELERAQSIRQARVREMVQRLNQAGVDISLEKVLEHARCKAPGRPHVARALVAHGACSSLDVAFERYLKKDRPGWVPKEKIGAARAIELIHAAGGVAVLAHPGLNHDDSVVGKLVAFGLDGLECHHPKHSNNATARYLAMAAQLGLVVTGGSDCHGRVNNRPTMGSIKVPVSHVQDLRARREARRR